MDEWNIPYSDIRIIETVGRGLVSEVYRGNWHGEVAIKRFFLPNPTAEQLSRFKEEVRGELREGKNVEREREGKGKGSGNEGVEGKGRRREGV